MARGIPVVALRAKEGLALINGTQVMTAIGSLAVHDVSVLARVADIAAAMTTEALRGTTSAFDPRIQAVRPHPGQAASARNLIRLMEGAPSESRIGIAQRCRTPIRSGAHRRCMELRGTP